jgi:isopentenyl phosphate kinase
MSGDVVLLKLGGSLITDKREREAVRPDVLARLAAELRDALARHGAPSVVVAHGSGSFGHLAASGTPLAQRDRRDVADPVALARAAAKTQDAAARLHRVVVEAMLGAGLPAFSLAPSSFLWRTAGELRGGSFEPLLGALDLGLLPVGYGDVVVDREAGASICSTEALLSCWVDQLAAAGRRVQRVLWLGETEGVHDPDGVPMPQITEQELETARRAAGGSSGVDVTGGMRLRIDVAWSLAERGAPSWILDGRRPGVLLAALSGEAGGTRVWSRRASGSAAAFEPRPEEAKRR